MFAQKVMFCHRFVVPASVGYPRIVFNCSKNGLVISWCYMYSIIMENPKMVPGELIAPEHRL